MELVMNRVCLALMVWGIVAAHCMKAKGIQIVSGPVDQTVRAGTEAVLECTVERKGRTALEWFAVRRDDQAADGRDSLVAISRDRRVLDGVPGVDNRYRITGDGGSYPLVIVDASPADSGEYRCGYESGGELTTVGAVLRVIAPPDDISPVCVILDPTEPGNPGSQAPAPGFYRAGQTVRMSCSSQGGVPRAQLVWTRGDEALTTAASGTTVLETVLRETDVGREFTCRASSPALDQDRSCSLTPARGGLDVVISPTQATVGLGGGVTFSCRADAVSRTQPPAAQYRWFRNRDEVRDGGRFRISGATDTLTLTGFIESDHGAVIACELQSPEGLLGRAQATVTITGVPVDTPTTAAVAESSRTPSVPRRTTTVSDAGGRGGEPRPKVQTAEIVAVSVAAGVAIGILSVLLVLFVLRKRRGCRRAGPGDPPQKQQQRPSTAGKPALAVQPRRHANGVSLTEDGYTMPRYAPGSPTATEPAYQTADVYEVVVASPVRPTAPKLELSDGLCWDYEIPPPPNHGQSRRDATMNATNPVYLEIIS